MTNPNNALGTPNAYSGLTSEEAFVSNADNLMSVGVVKGFTVAPNNPLGMSVLVGGVSGTPDRANVKNANGEVFTIQNRSHAPIQVNIAPASQTQSRLDVIVAYRNFGGTSDSAKQDNTKLVGIIAVAGTPSATPATPTDAQIRAAITADGGIGSSAGYFIVPRSISVPAGATTLSSSNINVIAVDNATIPASKVITPSASNGGADLGTVYSRTIASGYGSSISLKRVGNIVFANGVNSLTGAPSGINNLSETIPYGYRPSDTSSLVGFGFSGSTPSNQTWLLNAPSKTSPSSITTLISASGNQNFFVQGSYITADPITPVLGDAKIVLG